MNRETTDSPSAYPLHWPIRQPRTPAYDRERGIFKGTLDKATRELQDEIARMLFGSTRHFIPYFTLSTNLVLRNDGFPKSGQREPDDPGVAVYFRRSGTDLVFACDRYDRVWKNIRAITKSLEALRGIERWGSKQMFDQAFTGFAALPAQSVHSWRNALGLGERASVTFEDAKKAFREKMREANKGDASDSVLRQLNEAMEAATRELSE